MINCISPFLATPPPLLPPEITGETIINSSAIMLTWQAPSSSPDQEILNYSVCYVGVDGVLIKRILPPSQLNLTIPNLSPGTYTFNISAVYAGGSGPSMSVLVELSEMTNEGILGQPWFYAVVGCAGGLLLVVVLIVLCCICYCICCKRKYKGQALHN